MKSRPRLNLKAALLLACAGALPARGLTPTEWQHRQDVDVPAPGLVRLVLDPSTFDAGGPHQEDLRLLDPAGHETAYVLDRPPVPEPRTVRPAAFTVVVKEGVTEITIETGTAEPLVSVGLETPSPFFLRPATIEVSEDRATWTTLDRGVPLFRQWGAEALDLRLSLRPARYLRISVADGHDAPLPFVGATLRVGAATAPARIPVGATITRRDEFAGETVLTVALAGRHVPLASLGLDTAEPLFMRRVTVSVRDARAAGSGERVVAAGTLFRVAVGPPPARENLDLPLPLDPETREVLVHIHNGDSPPLALTGVHVARWPSGVLFRAPVAGAYLLLTGNPQAAAPQYDLAAFAADLRGSNPLDVAPGPLADTPNYHPGEDLGGPALPEVPLEGAALDSAAWTVRRGIDLATPGVEELELDLDALAKAERDYSDLRVMRAGRQIPYVLERPALERTLVLAPEEMPDPKRPSVSVWRFRLPLAGLPLTRIVLTSPTPLFQREVRVYEKHQDADDENVETVLASGEWSRTPQPGAAPNRVFELPERTGSDTLWIETDNGDNPGIVLGAVHAVYPVVRLIFKVKDPDGFDLVYGNPATNAPRYDLDLVSAQLLTSHRNEAKLVAVAAAAPPAANPFARLSGGVVFWAALALVVLVLLVVMARLLPKPKA
jgi:hypothetical protein